MYYLAHHPSTEIVFLVAKVRLKSTLLLGVLDPLNLLLQLAS